MRARAGYWVPVRALSTPSMKPPPIQPSTAQDFCWSEVPTEPIVSSYQPSCVWVKPAPAPHRNAAQIQSLSLPSSVIQNPLDHLSFQRVIFHAPDKCLCASNFKLFYQI